MKYGDKQLIRVKKLHEDAVLPAQATSGDAGFDLVAINDGIIEADGFIQYKTGISIEVPHGYHTEIFPRSSISKYDLALANSIGLVDNGYRGEILVRFKHAMRCNGTSTCESASPQKRYKKGDRIAQLVLRKTQFASFVWAEELSETDRGDKGFGSTSL